MNLAEQVLQNLNEVRLPPEREYSFEVSAGLSGETIKFTIKALKVERSYEDRSVFIEIKKGDQSISGWINGEQAVGVGCALANHGTQALDYNRLHAYEIIELLKARHNAQMGFYQSVKVIRRTDERPADHGGGFFYYDFVFTLSDKAPEYTSPEIIRDRVVYWSPFPKEYKDQKKQYFGNVPVEEVGWSWQADQEQFQRDVERMKQEGTPVTPQ